MMPDREKVLKALEHCKDSAVCDGCPYETVGQAAGWHCPIYDDAIVLIRDQDREEDDGK